MKENNVKFDEAFEFVKSKRRVVSPNSGFLKQLKFYEVDLGLNTKEQVTEDLKTIKYIKDYKYFN
jgi:hypothetical protein